MLICNASLPFYSFAHKIIKVHFFMNEKSRNHSNFLLRSFPSSNYYWKATTLFLLFPFYLGLLEGDQSWQTHLEVFPCLWIWSRELRICYLYPLLNSLREKQINERFFLGQLLPVSINSKEWCSNGSF